MVTAIGFRPNEVSNVPSGHQQLFSAVNHLLCILYHYPHFCTLWLTRQWLLCGEVIRSSHLWTRPDSKIKKTCCIDWYIECGTHTTTYLESRSVENDLDFVRFLGWKEFVVGRTAQYVRFLLLVTFKKWTQCHDIILRSYTNNRLVRTLLTWIGRSWVTYKCEKITCLGWWIEISIFWIDDFLLFVQKLSVSCKPHAIVINGS